MAVELSFTYWGCLVKSNSKVIRGKPSCEFRQPLPNQTGKGGNNTLIKMEFFVPPVFFVPILTISI